MPFSKQLADSFLGEKRSRRDALPLTIKNRPAASKCGFPMILDAPTFELVLTPEAALGIIQKEVSRKRWAKWEVEDIRLVYTPYWIFSFDVTAEGAQPSGRVAMNA